MIDAIDRQILSWLQTSARLPAADIARRLEMAPSAVHQRIRKLEERGAIQGYAARVDPEVAERALCAFVFLRTDEGLRDAPVARALAEMPEVLELHDIAGEDCYLAKVRVRDTEALHALLRERIARLELVRSTSTVIVLKTFKESSVLALDGTADQTEVRP